MCNNHFNILASIYGIGFYTVIEFEEKTFNVNIHEYSNFINFYFNVILNC